MSTINKKSLVGLGFTEMAAHFEFEITDGLYMVATKVKGGYLLGYVGEGNRFLPEKHEQTIGVKLKDVLDYIMRLSMGVGAECIRLEMIETLM